MPPFTPADEREDEQQQRMRPPWLPDGVPADVATNDNYSQGSDPDRPTFGARIAGDVPRPKPPASTAQPDNPPAPPSRLLD